MPSQQNSVLFNYEETDWKEEALCAKEGLKPVAFLEDYERGTKTYKRSILRLCKACPSRSECFKYAQKSKSYGVFGGAYFLAGKAYDPLDFNRRWKSSWI